MIFSIILFFIVCFSFFVSGVVLRILCRQRKDDRIDDICREKMTDCHPFRLPKFLKQKTLFLLGRGLTF